MTQANAALAEQSAASAASLSSRIGQLNDLVAAFRTGHDDAGRAGAVVAYRQPAPTPVRAAPASEPARLRQLAEAAFVQTRAPAAAPRAPAPAPIPRAPAKKVANGHNDTGWEEF
jgi:hypothetical protein